MLKRLMRVVVLAATSVMMMTAMAQAETWRLAHIVPPDSPEGQVHQKFADLVREYSNGELDIQIFPAGQLGATPELLQQLGAGLIHIFPEGVSVLHRYQENLTWTELPFLFDDREHWQRFMQSDLVQGWFDKMRSQEGITFIGDPTGVVRGPYRVLVTTTPTMSLADVQGMKLRMFENELFVRVWQHLGAEAIVLPWTDVYESLRLGTIDAVTSPISLVEPMKFYEPAKHIIRTDEYPQSLAYMTNQEAWENLDPNSRSALLRAQEEVAPLSAALANSAAEETLSRMAAGGAEFAEPDMSEFVERMRSYYSALVEEGKMPAEVFEQINATRDGE